VHLSGLFHIYVSTRYGSENVEFANVQQGKQIYRYKNTKEKNRTRQTQLFGIIKYAG